MNIDVFSKNMKKFRIAKKYTQEEVAEKLSVTAQTVSRWECGTNLPDVLMLPEIAEVYGIVVDDLFKKHSVAYENYAQRLSAVYEVSKEPEDFLRCRLEYQKLMRSGELSVRDKWDYAWLHKAMMYYCMAEALKWFDEVLSDKSDKNSLPYRRAASMKMEILFTMGDGKKYIEEQQSKIDGGGAEVDEREWLLLIEAYEHDKQFEKALSVFDEAIKKYPDNWEMYFLAGIIYMDLKKYDEAIESFEMAEKLGTYFCDGKYEIANCCKKLDRYREAYQIYLEIADIHRRNGYEVEAEQAIGYAKEIEEKIK